MFKEQQVIEWAHEMARKRPERAFTAGECAREAGVSVNTAKKYLKKLVSESDWLYDFLVEMRNGITATCYAFQIRRED